MKKKFLITTFLFILVSCNKPSSKLEIVLDDAGDNKEELQKVLNFYKKNPADSLKYKAAVFLIENMVGHSSYKPLAGFEAAFDSISRYPMGDYRKTVFRNILDSVSKKVVLQEPKLIPDCQFVTSKYLINTIELAFKAWIKIPKNRRASFDDFCNYILPYKNGDEPIEEKAREKLAKKYLWVSDLLQKGTPLNVVVDSVSSEFAFEIVKEVREYYPQTLSMSQLEDTRYGICSDGVNYLVNVFRSIGVVSAQDLTPHWGNHPALGHSWLYVKYGNEEYSTDVKGKIDLKKEYIGESIPNVYRQMYSYQEGFTYQSNAKEVTKEYVPTVNVSIYNVLDASNSNPILCVFDRKREWSAVCSGNYKNQSFNYNNIGVNVLYMASSRDDDKIEPANYPFFIDKEKKIHFYKPNTSVLRTIILTRKCALSSPRSKRVLDWMKNLNEGIFQGANNPNFDNAETLYKITSFNSTHSKNIVLKGTKKFQYVRFYANNKESYLAKLAFYGANGKQLTGEAIKVNNRNFKWDIGAYDDDPLSFSGGIDFSLGLKLPKPTAISAIEFQVRNDGNHINIGERYELLYWNKGWKTLGTRVAKDTVLHYKVPDNSLLWLKNHTGGNEEHLFIVGKNKKQQWLGADNY